MWRLKRNCAFRSRVNRVFASFSQLKRTRDAPRHKFDCIFTVDVELIVFRASKVCHERSQPLFERQNVLSNERDRFLPVKIWFGLSATVFWESKFTFGRSRRFFGRQNSLASAREGFLTSEFARERSRAFPTSYK